MELGILKCEETERYATMRMAPVVFSVIGLLVGSKQPVVSQNEVSKRTVMLNYPGVVSNINAISKCAVYVSNGSHAGTGTFVKVKFSDSSSFSRPFVLTAKHLTELRDSNGKLVRNLDTLLVHLNLKQGGVESRRYRVIARSSNLDLAILSQPLDNYRSFTEYDVTGADTTEFAVDDEIFKGQTVFIAGFPLGMGFDSDGMSAVLQSGIVALKKASTRVVVIDIPVNRGNSGCPAFLLNNEGRWRLLGLVFEYQPATDYVLRQFDNGFEVVPDDSSRGKDRFILKKGEKGFMPVPLNSSLGRVVLCSTLKEEIAKLVRRGAL